MNPIESNKFPGDRVAPEKPDTLAGLLPDHKQGRYKGGAKMPNYISGFQVMQELEIEDFELVEYAKNGLLRPYNKYGKRICDIQIKKQIEGRDEYQLHELKEKLNSLQTLISAGRERPLAEKAETELKERIEAVKRKIKEFEDKGVKPLGFARLLPDEYQDCAFWEYFEMSENEEFARETSDAFVKYMFLVSDVEKLKRHGEEASPSKDIKAEENRKTEEKPSGLDDIQKFVLRYENEEQFCIKPPGKPFMPCTYKDLDCKNPRIYQFKYLLEAIENGSFSTSDRNSQKNFERGCEKFAGYIRKEFLPSLPKNFKIYEKEGCTYRLIFERAEDASFDPYRKRSKKSKKELLDELRGLCAKLKNPPYFETDEKKREWESNLKDQISNIFLTAQNKGVTTEEIKNIIEPDDLSSLYEEETKERKHGDVAKDFIFGENKNTD